MTDSFLDMFRTAGRDVERMTQDVAALQSRPLEALVEQCVRTFAGGHRCWTMGNGGSATQAEHLAAEWVNRYEKPRRALGAVALTVDGALLTSIANDDSFDQIFARQVEALARPGDLVLAFSTSGNSANVNQALRYASRRGIATAAILGRDGGAARGLADVEVVVAGDRTDRIQEVQLLIAHAVCQQVEQRLGLVRTETPALTAES